jgi:hypothetical protein
MSTAIDNMNHGDMRDADWAIVDELRNGRANAPLISERADYSTQYIRERLGRLKEDDVVISLGHGLYEINEEEVPDDA